MKLQGTHPKTKGFASASMIDAKHVLNLITYHEQRVGDCLGHVHLPKCRVCLDQPSEAHNMWFLGGLLCKPTHTLTQSTPKTSEGDLGHQLTGYPERRPSRYLGSLPPRLRPSIVPIPRRPQKNGIESRGVSALLANVCLGRRLLAQGVKHQNWAARFQILRLTFRGLNGNPH